MHGWFTRLLCACLLTTAVAASAAAAAVSTDRIADYAQAMPLRISGTQAVVQLSLPRAVYLGAQSPDLDDLRLFDAKGTVLPFALLKQVQQKQENRSSALVGIFPVRGSAGNARSLDGLEIRAGENGAYISVKAPTRRQDNEVLAALVLDLGVGPQARLPVDALVLALPAGMKSYSAQLVLDVSDDLQEWEEIGAGSVSWLINNQGASVTKNRIVFGPQSFRFARLRWIAGEPIEFATIHAEFVAQQRTGERWESIVLQTAPAAPGADLVYETSLALPVESLGLELQGKNVVMPVIVGQYRKMRESGPGGKTTVQLQPVVRASFYQLTQNGQRRVSGDVVVPLTHASQWVVRPQTSVPEQPALRLRWKPASIVFVASGTPPYTLAFGRAGAKPSQVPVSQVAPGFSARELAMLEAAVAGEAVPQHGNAQGAGKDVSDPAHTNVFWLWAMLLFGVAVLAVMAWKLVGQMKKEADEPPSV